MSHTAPDTLLADDRSPLFMHPVYSVRTGDFDLVPVSGCANLLESLHYPLVPSSPRAGSHRCSSIWSDLTLDPAPITGAPSSRLSKPGDTVYYTALTCAGFELDELVAASSVRVDEPVADFIAKPVTAKSVPVNADVPCLPSLSGFRSFAQQLPSGILTHGGYLTEGGNGSIWAACENSTGKLLVIKTGRLPALAIELEAQLFLGDVPDWVPLLKMTAAFSINSQPYIAFERMGGDLYTSVLEPTNHIPLCRRTTQAIVRQVTQGLAHLESVGVIHADIKSDNILLHRADYCVLNTRSGIRTWIFDPNVKIGDFGAAVMVSGSTREGGTDMFLPPERILGFPWEAGKSDAFSFGCTFFEIVTGISPFVATNSEDIGERLRSMMRLLDMKRLPGIMAEPVSKSHSTLVKKNGTVMWPRRKTAATKKALNAMAKRGSIDDVVPYGEFRPDRQINSILKKMLAIDLHSRWTARDLLKHPFMIVEMYD